ncbi:MAG TPA: TetR/AcrR family transcriptional regulator [Anaerolineae bacterium]|nr:TetR/AcrR family transcriptional regulator [Anaerolineae bacterium]HPL30187.1 TetR/AcrR family transcriptional regulator [Anaerolineae bacterium]
MKRGVLAKTPYHHGDLKNALIEAGIEVLAHEGVQALSLRRVARRAGVSHAAPYAHFADKQALVAAISTEGYGKIYERLRAAIERHRGDPVRQLVEAAWAYVKFATGDSAHFKITLSGVVEREQEYPALVAATQRSFALVIELVQVCQAAGVLRPGPADLMAASVWGLVHGLASLILEGQVSHTLLERYSLKEMLVFSLSQIMAVEVDVQALSR